jgi:hypothetical protein
VSKKSYLILGLLYIMRFEGIDQKVLKQKYDELMGELIEVERKEAYLKNEMYEIRLILDRESAHNSE